MPEPLKLTRIPSLKTIADFRAHGASLGVDLPCDDAILPRAHSPLAQPVTAAPINGKTIGNRIDTTLICIAVERPGKKCERRSPNNPKIPRMLSTHAKGLLITACGVLIISPDGLLTRLIVADHWTMIFWRALLLSFGMWLVLGFTCPNRVWQQYKTLKGAALLKVVAYSLGTISFIFAITHTSVANTLIILSTTPLFAAIISRVLLKEKIETRTLIAIGLVAL